MRPCLAAGAQYFSAVFAAGFLMGTIRTIAVAPRIGELYAVMAEVPLMLLFSWLACKFVMGRYPQITAAQSAFAMGGFALLLLLIAEALLSIGLAGRSLAQHVSLYREMPTQIGLLGQLLFALFPYLRSVARDETKLNEAGKTGDRL